MKLAGINNLKGYPLKGRSLLRVALCWVTLLLLFMGTAAAAASYQPDLMVKLASEDDSSYLGQGVYETTALIQSKSQAVFPGTSGAFRILLKNAGDAPDSFLVKGTGSAGGCTVLYLDDGGTDRTAAVTGAGFATGTLAPGGSLRLQVQVAPTVFTPGASYRVAVSAASHASPGSTDQVKAETVACTSTAAVTVSAPPDAAANPGAVVNYPYTVTNVGNSVNSFALSVKSGSGWPGALYADDGAGGGVAGDGVRQAGENQPAVSTGSLAPGGSYRFFLAVTVPAASLDGAHDDSRLTAAGQGASATGQVTTTARAAAIFLSEDVRNITRGGPFLPTADAFPGETLEYRMTVSNSGSAPATGVGIDAPVPADVSCVPGSLWIGTGSGGDGAPCAQADCGFVREATGSISARLGQGATDATGGTLLPGKTLYVYYRVQVL